LTVDFVKATDRGGCAATFVASAKFDITAEAMVRAAHQTLAEVAVL
jgi:hypothetical protein